MICVSLPREHIFLVIYVPLPGKHEPKGVVKVKIAQNNSQISEGGITVKPGQDSIYELIIRKVNPFVASVTCSLYQFAFK